MLEIESFDRSLLSFVKLILLDFVLDYTLLVGQGGFPFSISF